MKSLILIALTAALIAGGAFAGDYPWQKPQAKVLPNGDLQWAPEPFKFQPGKVVRYIDFEGGNDANDGASRDKAWKHHPWDTQATGKAAEHSVPGTTYIFKGGVVYRGSLIAEESAPPLEPTQLTCDPDWGKGQAVIAGSDRVTGWKKGADHEDIPEASEVWVAQVDYLPRRLWEVGRDGKITRLKLARTPNWEVSNPQDVMREWWTWKKGDAGPIPGQGDEAEKVILAYDPRIQNYTEDYFKDAVLWTEWGFVMSTPVSTRVDGVDTDEGVLGFKGIYYFPDKRSQGVYKGQRWYVEDKPHYLDQAGEVWVEKTSDASAKIYLRLPGDRDPNATQIEAARRYSLIESASLENVRISNLAFRFNNRDWYITRAAFFHKEIQTAGIRIDGTARGVSIGNCTFEHLTTAITAIANNPLDRLDHLTIHDNVLEEIDNKGMIVSVGLNDEGVGPFGRNVRILRNKLHRIGMRSERLSNSAAIDVGFPQTAEIAGNFLTRVYGPGVFVFGGKKSGAHGEAPLTRILVHHNKVVDSLLSAHDWGGIETWQGGPHYVWNNISGNPGGYRNSSYDEWEGNRHGHAYYLDGSFKNYLFNNIAWGKHNDLDNTKLANSVGIKGIIGYQNTFLNNTVYNFKYGSDQQRPDAGRNKFLGNIFQDISKWAFYYAKARGEPTAINEDHVPRSKGKVDYRTMAWARNVLYDISGQLAAFEEHGQWYDQMLMFSRALDLQGTLSPDAGKMAKQSPLRDPEDHDFRPVAGSAAIEYGARTFVPWGLYATVGEWHFTENRKDPSEVIDEHWYMTRYYLGRKGYMNQPMFPLKAVNVDAEDYIEGPLENWTRGVLKLNGRDQYLTLQDEKASGSVTIPVRKKVEGGWATLHYPDKVIPGRKTKIKVELAEDFMIGRQITAQLAYTVPKNWGGSMYVSESQTITGPGPYTFELDAEMKEDLRRYVFVVTISKTDDLETTLLNATAPADKAEPGAKITTQTKTLSQYREKVLLEKEQFRSPEIWGSNFLIEAYMKVEPGSSGVVIQKLGDRGYSLKVNPQGRLVFQAGWATRAAHDFPSLTSKAKVTDGKWHHVIIEADRSARRFRFYIDGRRGAGGHGLTRAHNLDNDADLYVGGTPSGENLAVSLEFLRISLGTLADAQTSIGELHAWQFDGPQYRDFTGADRGEKPDAGAIELKP